MIFYYSGHRSEESLPLFNASVAYPRTGAQSTDKGGNCGLQSLPIHHRTCSQLGIYSKKSYPF